MWTKEEKASYLREYRLRNKAALSAKGKAYYANNTEAIAARKKEHYANNTEAIAAKVKAYQANNTEAIAAQKKAYRANNSEAIAAKAKAYKANNSEEVAYLRHKVDAKKRGIPFNLTFEEHKELWKPYRADQTANPYKWAMCRHLDQGGYEVGNVTIQLLAKNTRDAHMWRAEAKAYEMDSAADDIGVGSLHVESSCEDL